MRKVGDRVGAILSADDTTVHLLGYGVYDGEHEPPFGPFGIPLDEYRAAVGDGPDLAFRNPRITLDDGRVVWGCQCWWGSEAAIRAKIGNKTVVPAVIPDDYGKPLVAIEERHA